MRYLRKILFYIRWLIAPTWYIHILGKDISSCCRVPMVNERDCSICGEYGNDYIPGDDTKPFPDIDD